MNLTKLDSKILILFTNCWHFCWKKNSWNMKEWTWTFYMKLWVVLFLFMKKENFVYTTSFKSYLLDFLQTFCHLFTLWNFYLYVLSEVMIHMNQDLFCKYFTDIKSKVCYLHVETFHIYTFKVLLFLPKSSFKRSNLPVYSELYFDFVSNK